MQKSSAKAPAYCDMLRAIPLLSVRSRIGDLPSHVSHHTALEVAWTLTPALILVLIAISSFRLVYFEDRISDLGITIKVMGHQSHWEYGYPDNGGFSFISSMI